MSKDQISAKVGSRGQFMVFNAEGGYAELSPQLWNSRWEKYYLLMNILIKAEHFT